MRDPKPVGYFVHHQGRGHAVRAAMLAKAIAAHRPVTLFCARDDIFPVLAPGVEVVTIPSLFERTGDEAGSMDWVATPRTLHCAPLGWPGIRSAMARIAGWFDSADPALMICDVSAEIAQLARICSVPHVMVLQHGDRSDEGHVAANDGAAGLLAPFHRDLAPARWSHEMTERVFFAPGLGAGSEMPDRDAARRALGRTGERPLALVISGGGGDGVSEAPLGVAARTFPGWDWVTIGEVRRDWHATSPSNLSHRGWVDDAPAWISAADLVVSSTGNTTCQQVMSAARPWIAVPEWRYFDEQVDKADALARAGVATSLPHLPASAHGWRQAVDLALAAHDPDRQRSLARPRPPGAVADWLERLIERLWHGEANPSDKGSAPMDPSGISVVTLARGRDDHLSNVVAGLARQTVLPDELVIAVMQEDAYDLPDAPFPIRQLRLSGDDLPLAAARNRAAEAARGETLIFLDVDCIPHPELVADYRAALDEGGLAMGEVLYLPGGATDDGLDYARFDAVGEKHSDRRGPPETGKVPCDDYRCFWSLNFAMTRGDWDRIGGFDTRFTGYGGEDTDFGRMVAEAGMPIWWTKGARVYHQYHPHAMPPVHHLRSIVRNAEIFAEKWGHRTMEHWLHAFRLMGLIENTPDGLRIIREPGPSDLALCRQTSDQPYSSTRRVLDQLQEFDGSERDRRRQVEEAQSDMLRVAAE